MNKKTKNCLVDVDVPPAQINLGQLDLFLQLVVRLGDVVERHDRHSQPAEQVASERDQGVEGELSRIPRQCLMVIGRYKGVGGRTTGMTSYWTVAFRGTRPR